MGLNVRHRQRLPAAGPAIMVANHNSHLDTVVMMTLFSTKLLPRLRPIAAADYFLRNRLIAWFATTIMGIIPIERTGRAPDADPFVPVHAALEAVDIVILFPEGTRTRDGSVGAFRRGLALLVKRTGAPVVPAGLRGPFRALPRGRMFPLPVSCALHLGPQIPAEEILAPGGLHRLRGQVAELAGAPLGSCPAEEKIPPNQVGAGREHDSSDDEDSSNPGR